MLDNIRNKAQSFGVKLIFAMIIIVFVFWGMGNMAGSSSGALAVVNGEKITLQEFGKEMQFAAQAESKANPDLFTDAEKYKNFKQRLLAEMVAARLRLQEAKRLGLVTTPHELKTVIDSYPVFHDENGKFSAERYKQMLTAMSMTPGEFEEDLGKGILESKLMRYVSLSAGISEAEAREHFAFVMEKRVADYVLFDAAEYAARAGATDEEVAAHYEQRKEEYRTPVRADVEYLLLTPDTLGAAYPVSDEEAEARYKADSKNYERPSAFQARHIFLPCPPQGSTEPDADKQIAEAEAKAAEVEKKLADGADFGDLAREYSKDPDSADNGGLLGWLEVGQTGAKEFDEAAMALEIGSVGKPVRTAYGIHIIKLEGKTDAHTVPLVEVKNSIVAQIGREKAEADFKGVELKAEEALQTGVALADFGKSVQVAPLETGLIAQEELEARLSLHKDARQIFVDAVASAAASGKESTIPVPLNAASGVVLVRIKEARPSEIPPLAEVKNRVSAEIEVAKGRDMAQKAAEEALAAFSGKEAPEAYKDKIKQSKPALRVFPVIEPLGQCPELVQALFSSSGAWLPSVHQCPTGPVIARVAAVEPIRDAEWEQLKGIFMAQYRQGRQNEAMAAYMSDLFAKAEIEQNLEMLDSLTPPRQ